MIRTAGLFLILLWSIVAPGGQGRQTMEIEADYDYQAVMTWLDRNVSSVEESTGAEVIRTQQNRVTLHKETKTGTQVFELQRVQEGREFFGRFAVRWRGTLDDFGYRLRVDPLPSHRSRITVTLTASTKAANSVEVNIELRKSLRGVRAFLEGYLQRKSR